MRNGSFSSTVTTLPILCLIFPFSVRVSLLRIASTVAFFRWTFSGFAGPILRTSLIFSQLHRLFSVCSRSCRFLLHQFFHESADDLGGIFLHIVRDMRIGIQRKAGICMPKNPRQRFRIHAGSQRVRGERMS